MVDLRERRASVDRDYQMRPPGGGQATITGNTLTVRNIATGAMGCAGDVGEQHLWVMEFLKRPIELTFSQGTLSWKSGTDTLSFKSE